MDRDGVAFAKPGSVFGRGGLAVLLALPISLVTARQATAADPACNQCVYDHITHHWFIRDNPEFNTGKDINDHCAAIEFPIPLFNVSADGTQTSYFEVQRLHSASQICSTVEDPYGWPEAHFIDQNGANIDNADPATYGVIEMVQQEFNSIRFNYTNPTKGPPSNKEMRTINIGITYLDQDQGGRELVTTMQIHVYRLPVLMTHGLWADRSSFQDMEDNFVKQSKLYPPSLVYRVDYSDTHDAPFTTNLRVVEEGTYTLFDQAATDGKIAAGKVNLVGHSMGGILGRLYTQGLYYHHDVFRAVTCNTPHSGSQMANLLLDEVWDPYGSLCAAIEDSGTGSCYNGAVCDLGVNSLATQNLLNHSASFPTDVQVHAVATTYDFRSSPLNIGAAVLVRSTWLGVLAQLQPGCTVPDLLDAVFNSDDSDLVVALSSQVGGLQADWTSVYPNQIHIGSVANPSVIDEVRSLLDQPTPNDVFTLAGFNPATLSYFSPTICNGVLFPNLPTVDRSRDCPTANHAQTTFPIVAQSTAPSLMITSPADGATLSAGEDFSVAVTGDPGIASIVLLLGATGGDVYLARMPGPAAVFDEQVPEELAGARVLTALGLDANGSPVAVSNTVSLNLTVPATLTSIAIYPSSIHLPQGRTEALEITGAYDDGIPRDLSAIPGMTYAFTSGHAAHSGVNSVTLNDDVDDSFTVTYQGVTSPKVTIHALPPLPLAIKPIYRHLGHQ